MRKFRRRRGQERTFIRCRQILTRCDATRSIPHRFQRASLHTRQYHAQCVNSLESRRNTRAKQRPNSTYSGRLLKTQMHILRRWLCMSVLGASFQSSSGASEASPLSSLWPRTKQNKNLVHELSNKQICSFVFSGELTKGIRYTLAKYIF